MVESDVRDELARLRSQMANERTILAFVRTSLMLVVTGATLIKFSEDYSSLVIAGWVVIVLGLCVCILGGFRYVHYRHEVSQTRQDI